MNIEKAIEVLTQDLTCDFHGSIEDWHGALHLGIDALKRIQDMRLSPCTTADEILPSESEE